MAMSPIKAPEPIPANIDPATRVAANRFVASLQGTADHVFGPLIMQNYGHFAYSVQQWRQVLAGLKVQPVPPRLKGQIVKIRRA